MLLDVLERKDNLDTKGTLEFKIKYMFVGSLSFCIFHAFCVHIFNITKLQLQFHILLASRLGCKKTLQKNNFHYKDTHLMLPPKYYLPNNM